MVRTHRIHTFLLALELLGSGAGFILPDALLVLLEIWVVGLVSAVRQDG
jgi:hypothetical protein